MDKIVKFINLMKEFIMCIPGLLKKWVGELSEFIKNIREIILFFLLVVCIFVPSQIPKWACSAGITEISISETKFSTQCAVNTLERVTDKLNKNITEMDATSKVDHAVSPDAVQAVIHLEKIAPKAVPSSGWIFLGHIDDNQQWLSDTPKTVRLDSVPKINDQIQIARDVYLRDETSGKQHVLASIISVALRDEIYSVDALDPEPGRPGIKGQFIWARVTKYKPKNPGTK